MNSTALLLLPFSMLIHEQESTYPVINSIELEKTLTKLENLKAKFPLIKFTLLRATKQPLETWQDMIHYSNSSIVKTFSKEIEEYAQTITTDYDIQTYLLEELIKYKA